MTNLINQEFTFRSRDGTLLEATLVLPQGDVHGGAVLVHGITVDRNEEGFYTEMARRLANTEIASLRFDLRGHGHSEGKFEEITLLSVVNDISAACDIALRKIGLNKIHLIAASFGGGLSAMYAANMPSKVASLILLNPLLDYKRRMLETKSYWREDGLTEEGIEHLRKIGWLPHGNFRMGRYLINELMQLKPYETLKNIVCPVLIIHGTLDSAIPYEISEHYSKEIRKGCFVAIEGADHGFIKPEDEKMTSKETIAFRERVFGLVVNWVRENKMR